MDGRTVRWMERQRENGWKKGHADKRMDAVDEGSQMNWRRGGRQMNGRWDKWANGRMGEQAEV